MKRNGTTDPFDKFELLPPAYRTERQVVRAMHTWIAVAGVMVIALGALSVSAVIRMRQNEESRQQLASNALPLLKMRRDVLQLQLDNERRERWCRVVETARPDDNALQSLATVTAAAEADRDQVRIDRLEIRLPLEYPISESETPPWAAGKVAITARVDSAHVAQDWVARLNASERIEQAAIDDKPRDARGQSLEISARPLTTRVLP